MTDKPKNATDGPGVMFLYYESDVYIHGGCVRVMASVT